MLPSFVIVNLALGAVALVLLLPLRSAIGALPKLLFGFCVGLLAGIVGVNVVTSRMGASRFSNIRPVVKYLLQDADASKAQLLIVGSSYTALGVDDGLVQKELAKKGDPVQVLELAIAGNFMISQDYTIDRYLAHAKKVPEFIFIELGPENSVDSGDMGPSYLNTGTAIADHGPGQLAWRARSIAAYDASPLDRLVKVEHLTSHLLFNVFNFGLSGQLLADKDVSPTPAFLPEDNAHKPLTKADVSPIEQPAAPISTDAIPPNIRFIVEFRRMQVRKLKALGARIVGFYQPILTPTGLRAYGIEMCQELRDVPCITADNLAIRREFDDSALWFDKVHLLRPGAEKYSAWLADRLAAALPPSRSAE